MVIERESNAQPTLLSASKLDSQELFTYYNITVGADVVQHPSAKAITTISKTMTLRDLLQAVWRMRGLDAGQKVDFAIPEGLLEGEEVEPEAIFRMCTMNQAVRQREDNLKALKQKMAYTSDRCIENVLLSPTCVTEDAIELSKVVKAVLSKTMLEDPFTLFGAVEKEADIKVVVEAYINSTLAEIKTVYESHPIFERTYPWKPLESEIRGLVDYTILPEREIIKNDENYGQEMQVKTEVQAEKKTLMNIKLELEIASDINKLKAGVGRPTSLNLIDNYLFNQEVSEPIFQENGWKRTASFKFNNYLRNHNDQLIGIDVQKDLFFQRHPRYAELCLSSSKAVIRGENPF